VGATENARLENGAQEMQGWKMRDWKMKDKKCRGGKCETGKWSTKMLLIAMRSFTLSEKSNHWTPYIFRTQCITAMQAMSRIPTTLVLSVSRPFGQLMAPTENCQQ